MAEVIASESCIVHDDALGIDRQIVAGQPVPPDLVDAYQAKTGDTSASAAPTVDDNLESATVDELKAEAERRGIEVEGTGANGRVTKDDLLKALG